MTGCTDSPKDQSTPDFARHQGGTKWGRLSLALLWRDTYNMVLVTSGLGIQLALESLEVWFGRRAGPPEYYFLTGPVTT